MPAFRPLAINALYTGIERGLIADALSTHTLGARAHAVCTGHVAASHGVVTDVLEVPTDTVAAQVEHLFKALPPAEQPGAAKISIVNHAATVDVLFDLLKSRLNGPLLLDLTLSGPNGEDITDAPSLDALKRHFKEADVVTARIQDAALVAGMEIRSLDDVQVAAQRIQKMGARRVLLRCGLLPKQGAQNNSVQTNGAHEAFETDLLYDPGDGDGDEFSLFEAPHLTNPLLPHGASSLFTLAILFGLQRGEPLLESVREAKAFVTESLRSGANRQTSHSPQ